MTMISPLDSICRKVTAEIILSVSGEISLRDGTNPTFLHLEIHTTTSQTIYIFINLHIFHWFRTCEGEGGSRDPFNQKFLNALQELRILQAMFVFVNSRAAEVIWRSPILSWPRIMLSNRVCYDFFNRWDKCRKKSVWRKKTALGFPSTNIQWISLFKHQQK